MQATAQLAVDHPRWQAAAEQRLRVAMVLATAMLAGILALVRLPAPAQFAPLIELVVQLSWREPVVIPETELLPPRTVPTNERALVEPAPAAPADEKLPATTEPDTGVPHDWEALRDEAIREVLDAAARERNYSVNPPFEKARREAAVRFRASIAPGERHIWDNVEKDQLGRTILRDGNCFRVLDDPNIANQWAFETFDQYIVYCDFVFGKPKGEELPWVELIRERYPYLRDPVAIP